MGASATVLVFGTGTEETMLEADFGSLTVDTTDGSSIDFEDLRELSVTAVPGGGIDFPLVAVISDKT